MTDGRATRWDDHKMQRRERILEAALEAVEGGGTDIGVQQIAERAQVPRSVVYRIFADRGDLDEQIRLRIIEVMMTELGPVLTPHGTVREAIELAVETYLRWIIAHPRLHAFLGKGAPSRKTVGSRAVTGTKTAIGVQLGALLAGILDRRGVTSTLAEPMAFALVGLVDATVNRWLSQPENPVPSADLARFLETSIWSVLDANLRALGVELEPSTTISEL
ncbi:TetR family transcriptional regulator [Rhodococcus hoagii]|uniref:TetR family transcriptional regulator n=1 Tax=Rhodococcus hoagii TaxID=43767 RepID=A0AAE5CHU5_RHOHA|nr:TetR family transcriptional regulator [Prescottella equi]MBM4493135.1 TetR family transcriptional regulator [Prescottella equi]MBM4541868.1 TetR family transcriptional regulator [Prescottella equi]MBM4715009.1 TetR family transcriptional regulator [Prescottella equi]NKS10639.1 TetR family transcriptional regulator [Prescottella equi]